MIAEIGNNHEGRFDVAERLVRLAAECGADAVKFQTFRTEHYVGRTNEQRFSRLKRFELTGEQFAELAALAHLLGLLFLSTPFDLESAAILEPMVDAYKIASGDNDFFPLITRVAQTGKAVLISSGASDLAQARRAVECVRAEWNARGVQADLAVLHCVSCYPVPPDQANLRAIQTLATALDVPIGYSDHTVGTDAALIAVALGARLVEKHFTLDHAFSGFRDHQLSADPGEMRDLVVRVRRAVRMLGNGNKVLQPCEIATAAEIRRSVVASRDLSAGHQLEAADVTWTRPAGGLPPGQEGALLGRRIRRSVSAGQALRASDVE